MNGPSNYREATAILTEERCDYGCPHTGCPHEMAYLARAQVHATLSLTAAVVARGYVPPADRHEWQKALDPEYDAEVAAATAAARAAAQANPAGFGWAQVTP